MRREYRGANKLKPVFAKEAAFSWWKGWFNYYSNSTVACEEMINTYETRVNEYGYSLKHVARGVGQVSPKVSKYRLKL